MAESFLPLFKRANIPAEFLTLFRIIFGIAIAALFLTRNYLIIFIFLTLYQFILLLDYIDGKLAKHQKRFSIKWVKIDFLFHYITSFLFLLVLTIINYLQNLNNYIFYIGLIGSTIILISTFFGMKQFQKVRMQRQNYKGKLSKIYSFVGIENPFSLFYFLVIFDLLSILIVFYTFLYLLILLRKLK